MYGYVVRSCDTNVYRNLAYEKCLVEAANLNRCGVLYLWRNESAIIVGRNQDIYAECDLDYVGKYAIRPARRNSGGGAVYHDLGNINYTIILPKEKYDTIQAMKVIVNALSDIGIEAYLSGRNDVCVGKKKVSGNAFYSDGTVGICHGTLLLDTNLEIMNRVLTPNDEKLSKNGIKSVRARVLNLKESYPWLNCEIVFKAITKSFYNEYRMKEALDALDISEENFRRYTDVYSSKAWIYDFPNNDVLKKSRQFEWGQLTIMLDCKEGKNMKCKLYTDSLEVYLIERIELILNEAINRGIIENLGTYIGRFIAKENRKVALDVGTLYEEVRKGGEYGL